MKKSILGISLLLVLPFAFSSCGSEGGDAVPNKVDSLKSGLEYLYYSQNYTFSYKGSEAVAHDLKFTPNAMGLTSSYSPVVTDIYVQNNDGVFILNYDDDKYVASELLSDKKDLWSKDYYHSMFHKGKRDYSVIKSGSNEAKIKDKTFKLAYLKMLGYQETDYVYVNDFTVRYVVAGSSPTLEFEMTFNEGSNIYVAHDFGTTKFEEVETYLNSGKSYYTPTSSLNNLKRLMNLNNYKQEVYNFDGENSGFNSTEYFTDKYYYHQFYNSTSYYGAIELEAAATDEHPDLRGCYYFTVSNGTPSIQSRPVYDEPDIVSYYHYPSFLKLWDNLHLMHEWRDTDDFGSDVSTPTKNGYVITNAGIINDFASNFSINDNFSGQRGLAIGVEFKESRTDENSKINFYYKFMLNGYTHVLPFPFSNFGKVDNPLLNRIYREYND